ncbi:MAG: 4Fe-4S ferredoxin, partial [Bacteroidota bacterium]
NENKSGNVSSQLKQWPIQLHLLNPMAPYFKNADVLLAADCVAFAMGNFHADYLKGKVLAIACPKLDSNKESYIEKIRAMIDESNINTLTVMMMEVPCCGGLQQLVTLALQQAKRKVPIKAVYVSMRGEVLNEEWV